MMYELWETQSGNIVAAYSSEAAALRFLARAIQHNGREYAKTIVLAREDEHGETTVIAEGLQLADLALEAAQKSGLVPA